MKPEKEKAIELKDKFQSVSGNNVYAKAYAIICVEEIMEIISTMVNNCVWESSQCHLDLRFWRRVKREIQYLN
jgi:capsid portal protein